MRAFKLSLKEKIIWAINLPRSAIVINVIGTPNEAKNMQNNRPPKLFGVILP